MNEKVDFEYVPNLVEAMTQRRVEADLIVGSWINTPTVTELMAPVSGVAAAISSDGVWVPLAFTLPTIVYETDGELGEAGATVTLDELGRILYGDGEVPENAPLRFVPSYRDGTPYVLLRSLGLVIGTDTEGDPIIDRSSLATHLETLRAWQTRYHRSLAAEHAYRERYLYEPWQRLLEKDRLEAVYLPSDQLLSWDFHAEERWAFSFLVDEDGSFFALDGVVYAGIPLSTDAERGATALLAWLTTPDVQIDLVGQKLVQRIDSFGLLGGFSTNERVNDAMLEEIYPGLSSHRFSLDRVRLPDQRARYWAEALERVVYPSLDSIEEVDLAAELARWYRQRGD